MPSTYTTNGGIELIATGEQSGTWGSTTNTNLQIIDRLTNGVGAISLSGTTHTLTTTDGALSDGQYAVLVFGGSPSGTNTVTISPNDADHVYIVKNNSGQSVVLTQGSGGNVTVANGKSAIVYADGAGAGAEVVDVTNDFDFQPLDAGLTSIAGLTTAANKMIYTTASDTYAVTDLTAAGRALLDDADAATQRTTLGLGSIATQAANNVSITGGSITGITDITVSDGGTGASSFTANNVLLGNGTSSFQTVAPGTSGNVLTSNGSTWTSAAGTSLATPLAVVGNASAGAEIRLPEDTDNGTSYVALKAPDALDANRTLTVPNPGSNETLGFLNIPQNSQSAAYTLVLSDSGKHILHPSADTTTRTFTIPANGSVAFPIGTAVTFINQNGGGDITIAITTDTLRLAGDGSTGSRTLTANGIATCVKITSTEWIISGTNLT